jgi:hypothetical protein
VAFCWPLLTHSGQIGVLNDWDQHLLWNWVPYETVVRYGQIPLWNPFVCGGMPMLGHPQSRWMTPFFVLHLVFGVDVGLRLEIIAHIALAFAGALVLGRTYGLSRIAAVAPAAVFAGCSYWYLHLAEGHTTWLAYAYLPWTLAAVAAGRPVAAGITLALAVMEGGAYAVAHALVALVVLAVYRAVAERTARPFLVLAQAGLMGVCLAAPKLLEMQPLLARYPRLTESHEAVRVDLAVRGLLDWRQDLQDTPRVEPDYGFHEYGAYVGAFVLVLALLGVWGARRAAIPWLVLFGMTVAFALGWTLGGEHSPWALLHRLPIFASLRIPSRFLVVAVLALGMLSGLAVERLARRGSRWRLALGMLLATAVIDMARVGPPNLRYVFERPAVLREPSSTFVQRREKDFNEMYSLARANMGALTCYEPLDPDVFPVGANEAGYRGERYTLFGADVKLLRWSPNQLALAVGADRADVLVINSNYDASWQVASGRGRTVNHAGLLAIEVPAGSQELVIRYSRTRFVAGLMIAIVSLGLGLWCFRR